MLGYVKPGDELAYVTSSTVKRGARASVYVPAIEVVHRALLIPHVDVEREEVNRLCRLPAQDLVEGG